MFKTQYSENTKLVLDYVMGDFELVFDLAHSGKWAELCLGGLIFRLGWLQPPQAHA